MPFNFFLQKKTNIILAKDTRICERLYGTKKKDFVRNY